MTHPQIRSLAALCGLAVACVAIACGPDTSETPGDAASGSSGSTSQPTTSSTGTTGTATETSGSSTPSGSSAPSSSGPDPSSTTEEATNSTTGEPIGPGETLWEWDPGENLAAVTVTDAGDVLVALIADNEDVVIRRLGGESGDDLEMWSVAAPPVPPPGTAIETDAAKLGAIGDDPVVGTTYVVLDSNGLVIDALSQIKRLGNAAWTFDLPESNRLALDATSDGAAVSDGSVVLALDPAGAERWAVTAAVSSQNVLSRDDGGAVDVGRSLVQAHDSSGQVVWEFDAGQANALDRFTAISRYPLGGYLLMREVIVDQQRLTSIGVLVELDDAGQQVRTLEYADPSFVMATDGEGNIFLPVRTEVVGEVTVGKFTPELRELWTWDREGLGIGSVEHLETDSEDALFIVAESRVFKVAP